ncbi:TolB family protein [Marilutibacter aestuarii]|uniref:TolB-like protein n=1 Tax=Marilutibacter aestuarii TaxID=1706195 RepID=A0A508APC8_9GAMM|nr:PD40 domain-containing protein [Lysobacter aestuarii]TQD51317.1 TolB-like protein [Lysobacter aestuarii]
MRSFVAVLAFSLLPWPSMAGAQGLSEYGIEGMHVVSTAAGEGHASVSADGQRIVWGAIDREGGAGGKDLWHARLRDGRWQDAAPLALNTRADEFDPMLSPDGRWLYFRSNRRGGHGGDDLYRAPALADGGFGKPVNLGAGVNTDGDEWAPMPGPDGDSLLFSSDGHGGQGRHDIFVAHWDGVAFSAPTPLPGAINTPDDEFDAAWLGDGATLVFARGSRANEAPVRVFVAQCDGQAYALAEPMALSFNTADQVTFAPAPDWSKPTELLVSGIARSPRAGKLDIYRTVSPKVTGKAGCLRASVAPPPR